jgi:hypothetical protein
MRCYYMLRGLITGVEALPGLSDEETIKRALELFVEKQKAHYPCDGFEVWDLARVVFQYPTPMPDKPT